MRAWSLSQPGHLLGPVARLGLMGPAQSHGPSWAQPEKKEKKIFLQNYCLKKYICDFPSYFYTKFCLVLVCIFIP
jgi:hypothetical protein